MTRRYAAGTDVSVEKSKAEADRIVRAHGASKVGVMTDGNGGVVLFELDGQAYKFEVANPDPRDRAIRENKAGYVLPQGQITARYEAELRRRWRVLIIALKVKFEIVESGAATIEREFLPYAMLPGGTVGELLEPELARARESGERPNIFQTLRMLPPRSE